MKRHIIFILFVCINTVVYGQISPPDSEKKSIKIPAQETKDNDSTSTALKIKPNPKPKITKTNDNINGIPVKIRELKPQKKEFSMFDDNNLRNPGEIFEKRYNKKLEEEGLRPKTMSDIFFGDVRVRGGIMNIRCRDHGAPDGDLIKVIVNDVVIIPNLVLNQNFKSFDINLEEGINTVVFEALNQGLYGANTAEFQVYDDEKVLVSSNRWLLLTGAKAKFLVIKDKTMPQLKGNQQKPNETQTENN